MAIHATYTESPIEAACEEALKLCRGSYQTNLILGWEAWSGATLKGKARKWSMKYAKSRDSLLRRIREANIPHHEERRAHGKRVMVLGIW